LTIASRACSHCACTSCGARRSHKHSSLLSIFSRKRGYRVCMSPSRHSYGCRPTASLLAANAQTLQFCSSTGQAAITALCRHDKGATRMQSVSAAHFTDKPLCSQCIGKLPGECCIEDAWHKLHVQPACTMCCALADGMCCQCHLLKHTGTVYTYSPILFP